MEETKEKIGFFRRMGIAIARPKEYVKLANQSVGNTIGTFVIVTLIQVILFMILIVLLSNYLISIADKYIPQIPNFEIVGGQFITEQNEPIVYKTDDSKMLFILNANIVLDEVKSVYANDVFGVANYMIIAKDGLTMKEGITINTISFEKLSNDVYTKSNLIDFYDTYIKGFFKNIFLASIFIFLLLILFVGKIIGGLIFGVFGMIVANMQNKKISFGKLFNIAMYAGVTTTLMFMFGGFILFVIPMWTGIKLVIISLYIIFAIKNMPLDNNNAIELK